MLHLHVWVCWTCVVDGRVVFGVAIHPIVATFVPVVTELFLGFFGIGATISRGPWTWFAVNDVRLVTPMAVEMSVWLGVCGWDQLI